MSKGTFAQSWTPSNEVFLEFSGVTVNRDWGKNSIEFIKALKTNVDTKFHPIGCDTIRSVLDHEIGHQLDKLLNIGEMDEIKMLFDSRTNEELTNTISRYAWENKNSNRYSEMIAEAWAEYCNNPNPREIAKVVEETIEMEYKKRFKKR